MYFKQLIKEDLGCACYILGCPQAGVCAIVDPRLDMVDEILTLTRAAGLSVEAVIETHNHADHVSGHGELARRTGARIFVHELAHVSFPHKTVRDGDEISLGAVQIRVLHTPGHRPEHIALVVSDLSRSTQPWFVLTGDSLFIGDVARPDLAVPSVAGAEALYDSLFARLLSLEDGVEIYPSHVAGSLCGRNMNGKTSSTIGFERKYNPALATDSRADFVRELNKHLPQRPPNMATILERNREDYTRFPAISEAEPLAPQMFQQAQDAGLLVLDTRSPQLFCAGHIPGALHVFLHGPAFPTRAGFITPPGSHLLLVAENAREAEHARSLLAAVGYDQVRGYLAGNMMAWQRAGLPVEKLAQLRAQQVYERHARLTILDVREENEWLDGHIAGALHIPFHQIEQRLPELASTEPIVVLCAGGQRSVIACSLLLRHGFQQVFNMIGGMGAWHAQNLPETQMQPVEEQHQVALTSPV